ncbi:UPF0738 family protein, partial [Bacillus safensis]
KANASGQMLVGSHHFAFLYFLDTDGSFSYLILPQHTSPPLKQPINPHIPLYFPSHQQSLQLIHLQHQLHYLIH